MRHYSGAVVLVGLEGFDLHLGCGAVSAFPDRVVLPWQ